ncbi:MAG TPA: Hsp20/alpha crystallin family protein [Pirellulales bacterium]|jgi:HSP20 family protein
MTTQVVQKENQGQKSAPQKSEQTSSDAVTTTEPGNTLSAGGGFNPFHRLRDEFNRLFDHFLPGWPSLGELQRSDGWGMDVQDDDKSVTVRAEAPGFEPRDFDVQVRGNQLTMCACQKDESADKEEGYRQWRSREFYRSVTLPSGVDPNQVDAEYRNGVLTVKIPRTEECKSRRIEVKG